jgi:hypothetical protein
MSELLINLMIPVGVLMVCGFILLGLWYFDKNSKKEEDKWPTVQQWIDLGRSLTPEQRADISRKILLENIKGDGGK